MSCYVETRHRGIGVAPRPTLTFCRELSPGPGADVIRSSPRETVIDHHDTTGWDRDKKFQDGGTDVAGICSKYTINNRLTCDML